MKRKEGMAERGEGGLWRWGDSFGEKWEEETIEERIRPCWPLAIFCKQPKAAGGGGQLVSWQKVPFEKQALRRGRRLDDCGRRHRADDHEDEDGENAWKRRRRRRRRRRRSVEKKYVG